ncbi:unnamed protein product, partial [Leptidea sinapis]
MSYMNLEQSNYIFNENERILDLVLATLQNSTELPVDPLLKVVPHHPALEIFCHIQKLNPIPHIRTRKRNLCKAYYQTINTVVKQVEWKSLLSPLLCDEAVSVFYTEINNIVDTYVPLMKPKSHKYPIWFSRGLIRTLRRKQKLWGRWKTYKNPRDYQEFSLLRARVKMLRYVIIEDSLKSNIKHFWKYTSSLKQSNSGYPHIMKYGNTLSSDPNAIVEMFSQYFQSVFEPSANEVLSDSSAV